MVFSPIDHVERGLIGDGNRGQVEIGNFLANQDGRVVKDREGFEPQEIHLQHPQVPKRSHGVLADDAAVIGAEERDILGEIAVADDDAGRVDAGVPLDPFQDGCVLPELRRRGLCLDGFLELGILVDGAGKVLHLAGVLVLPVLAPQGDVELVGDHLGDAVGIAVAQAHHAPDIADDAFRAHGSKGRDLGDCALAVLLAHIFDDLAAAILAEIDVNIRRADALGIQKALEEELVVDGIDIGDADDIGDDGACGGAAAGTDGDAMFARPVDEIPDDQEIIDEALLLQDEELALQPLAKLGRIGAGAVTPVHPLLAEAAEVIILGKAIRGIVVRVFWLAEFEFQIAALRDAQRIIQSLGMRGKECAHLGGAFKIKLGHVTHPALIRDIRARPDADHHVMRLVMGALKEMDIIRGDQTDAKIPGEGGECRIAALLRLDAVVVKLEVEVLAAEDLHEVVKRVARFLRLIGENALIDLALEAGAHSQQAGAVARQHLLVDAGL